jgi:hypothetical protein
MKNIVATKMALLALAGILLFDSCGKKKEEEEEKKQAEAVQETNNKAHSADQSQVQTETDHAFDDANTVFSGSSMGKSVTAIAFCGGTADTTSIASKIVYLNYDGTTPCHGYIKSGQIKVQLVSGTSWKNAGSTVELTYIGYKVKRASDGKAITINGSQRVTKLVAINWLAVILTGTGSTSYKTRANGLTITFDDGSVRTWSAAHTSSWSLASSIITIEHKGDTTISGISNVSHWGVNRFGHDFTTAISTPIQSNSSCGYWKPIAGVVTHRVLSKEFGATFNVDASGNPTTGCGYGYKVTWTGIDGTAKQAVIAY